MLRTDRLLLLLLAALGLLALLLGLDLGSDTRPDLLSRSDPLKRAGPPPDQVEATPVEPRTVAASEENAQGPATAALDLQFSCDEPAGLEGIVIRLLRVEEEGESRDSTVAIQTTGPGGLAPFRDLRPGSYRWVHDGSRSIVPVPPNERAAVAAEGERVVLRPGEDLSSGLLHLRAGDHRRILVPLAAGAVVSGRVVDASGPLTRNLALKLVTRERFVHPAGTEVERIVARQARLFASGEFRFDNVRPGTMELLGYWRDETGLSQLRLDFDLEAGESRDLGPVQPSAGKTLALRLRAVDVDGRELDPATLFGTSEVQRVIEVRPRRPDPDWPYQKIELPQSRLFELRGLPDAELRLCAAREDTRVNPPRAGWTRVGPPEFRIAGSESGPVDVVERWGRIAPLKIRLLDAESLATASDGCLLQLVDLVGGHSMSRRVALSSGVIQLRVPEGRYRVLLGELDARSFRQADSGEFRLGAEGRELELLSGTAGRIQASRKAAGSGEALRIGLPASGADLLVEPDARGGFRIDLPPGRYRLYDPERELMVEADRLHDLGELDGD